MTINVINKFRVSRILYEAEQRDILLTTVETYRLEKLKKKNELQREMSVISTPSQFDCVICGVVK